jgi:hypothetical protein
MRYFNLYTPLSFMASCIWNLAEHLQINLRGLAPIIFGLMIQSRPKKVLPLDLRVRQIFAEARRNDGN